MISVRDVGLSKRELVLVRLEGRAVSLALSLSRLGRGPKERRLIPDVESRGTCFDEDGVSGMSPATDEEALVVLPIVLFRLLIVTVEGGM